MSIRTSLLMIQGQSPPEVKTSQKTTLLALPGLLSSPEMPLFRVLCVPISFHHLYNNLLPSSQNSDPQVQPISPTEYCPRLNFSGQNGIRAISGRGQGRRWQPSPGSCKASCPRTSTCLYQLASGKWDSVMRCFPAVLRTYG